MRTEEQVKDITRRERGGSWLLWFGVLTGPIAWFTHMSVNYSLEEWFACSPATQTPGEVLGLGVREFAAVLTAVLAAITIAALVVSIRCWRKGRAVPASGNTPDRAQWMAIAGIMNSVLYLIIILFGFAPSLILGVCQGPP